MIWTKALYLICGNLFAVYSLSAKIDSLIDGYFICFILTTVVQLQCEMLACFINIFPLYDAILPTHLLDSPEFTDTNFLILCIWIYKCLKTCSYLPFSFVVFIKFDIFLSHI